jgi:hypothetical protein
MVTTERLEQRIKKLKGRLSGQDEKDQAVVRKWRKILKRTQRKRRARLAKETRLKAGRGEKEGGEKSTSAPA